MTTLKLSKWGNGHGIRISKDILEKLKIEKNNNDIKFNVSIENDNIILSLKKEKNLLKELFENFYDDPESYKTDIDWGNPVGNEVW